MSLFSPSYRRRQALRVGRYVYNVPSSYYYLRDYRSVLDPRAPAK